MFQIISLIVGTVSAIVFIYFLEKGKKFQGMINVLEDENHSMKEFYTVGFMWSEIVPQLSYGGKIGMNVKPYVAIIYGDKYCEFYSRVALAKSFTLGHFVIVFTSLVGGLMQGMNSLILLAVGLVTGFLIVNNTLDEPKRIVDERAEDYLNQFPNIVTKLSLMINSGMILREAWFSVAESSEGALSDLMIKSCKLMDNGKSDAEAIKWFGDNSGSNEIKKFSSALIQGMEKGNAELSSVLTKQASELWEVKRQRILAKGEAAAAKLLAPTGLIFVGILLIILTSAMSGTTL